MGLSGKRALVMGASTGLGRAVAEELAGQGARVAICARSQERLQETAREIGAEAWARDLSQPQAAAVLVDEVRQSMGGLDILVSNTGGPPAGDFLDLDESHWRNAFQGLWMSAVDSFRAALPEMRKRGWGRILLITSLAAKEPVPRLTLSNAYRAGLLGLVNSVSREAAPDGVTINTILPGYIRTDRLLELGVSEEGLSGAIPAGRLGEPRELAALAAFLASERASYITGQAIAVDGGLLHGI